METKVCFIKEANLHLIFGIVYFLASLTASIGNGFMLYIARRDPLKLFNKPTNVLNVSIGLNHLIASLFVLPILGTNSVLQSQEIVNGVAELFQDVMVHFVVTNASVLLLVLFLERYTAFVYPFLNRKNATIETNLLLSNCNLLFLLLYFVHRSLRRYILRYNSSRIHTVTLHGNDSYVGNQLLLAKASNPGCPRHHT